MSSPGENEQARANLTPAEELEFQSELDSAMSHLDSQLSHPRRRASDAAKQPVLPQLGQLELTSELLDALAWRVSEQMRRTQAVGDVAAAALTNFPTERLPEDARPAIPAGISLVIRVRRPLFHWRFWRRRSRRQAMVSFSDYRIT